jgi:hypothetical protein
MATERSVRPIVRPLLNATVMIEIFRVALPR